MPPVAGVAEFKIEPCATLLSGDHFEFKSFCARDVAQKYERQMQVFRSDQAPAAVLMRRLREQVQPFARTGVRPERKKQPAR
jgi:hypothetical protein